MIGLKVIALYYMGISIPKKSVEGKSENSKQKGKNGVCGLPRWFLISFL